MNLWVRSILVVILKKFRKSIEDRRSSRNPFWKIFVSGKDFFLEIGIRKDGLCRRRCLSRG